MSLDEVMLECRAMMEPQAQQRGISMTFPEFDNPCFVSSDRTRLKQILINLLSNAIKYNKVQGTVVVDYTVIAPDRIRINITDTGAGLRPNSWRSCSSRSIVSDKRPGARKARASASW